MADVGGEQYDRIQRRLEDRLLTAPTLYPSAAFVSGSV
jgi:hypothetical protein